MKSNIIKILEYILGAIGLIIVIPFALLYLLIKMFWIFFGSTIIAFIILMLMGFSDEQCMKYAAALGFLITIIKKYREISK